jgi:hypothetical protein
MAERLVADLGGRAVVVADEHRALHHAAATIAANHLVALLGQVARVAALAGVPLEAYLGLARGALGNVERLGPAAALTGPVRRGDEATVARHLAALPADERARTARSPTPPGASCRRRERRGAVGACGRGRSGADDWSTGAAPARLEAGARSGKESVVGEVSVLERTTDLTAWAEASRSAGRRVGLVPTMGALHEGHLSLAVRALAECDDVVLTVFVNPLQFAPGEDLDAYPRHLDADVDLALGPGVHGVRAGGRGDVPAEVATTVTWPASPRCSTGGPGPPTSTASPRWWPSSSPWSGAAGPTSARRTSSS